MIDKSRLTEINFTKVKKNSNAFDTNYSDKQYEDYFDVITMVENTPTVVRVCSYIDANGCLDYDCIDLQNNKYQATYKSDANYANKFFHACHLLQPFALDFKSFYIFLRHIFCCFSFI